MLALFVAEDASPSLAASVRLPKSTPLTILVQPVAAINFVVEDIIGIAGQEAPIELTLPSADQLQQAGAETGSFLLIRNVPQAISFSAGMSTGRVWVVPLREASDLRLVSQPRAVGNFKLEFSLIGPGNRVLAAKEAPVELRSADVLGQGAAPVPEPTAATAEPEPRPVAAVPLAPPALEPEPRPAAVFPVPPAAPEPAPRPLAALPSAPEPVARPAPAPAQPAKPVKPIGKEEEARLLKRGEQLITEGALSEARLILKWLADRGSGAGALALARSYDQAFVSAYPASAITPDMKEARRWYERAAELQNTEAKKRLSELPAR